VENSNVVFGLFAGFTVVLAFVLLAGRYFRAEMAEWIASLSKPSEKAIQQQSAAMLAQMEQNVTARKAKALDRTA
jgi:hypothetical protein